MASKTISVTDDVYELLSKLKLETESFGDVIKRLCKEKTVENLQEWMKKRDLWSNMDKEEEESWNQVMDREKGTFTASELDTE